MVRLPSILGRSIPIEAVGEGSDGSSNRVLKGESRNRSSFRRLNPRKRTSRRFRSRSVQRQPTYRREARVQPGFPALPIAGLRLMKRLKFLS
jgi:hypothetical protein